MTSLLGSGLQELGIHKHKDEWNEIQANRMAKRYFENQDPGVLDKTKGGTPWNDYVHPRKYVYDWYFAITGPPPAFLWWLLF